MSDNRENASRELIETLMAISIVSRRLATKLDRLSGMYPLEKGGNLREQNGRIICTRQRTAALR